MRNPRSVRRLAAAVLLPWILAAIAITACRGNTARGQEYNAPVRCYPAPRSLECDTDTDCFEKYGY